MILRRGARKPFAEAAGVTIILRPAAPSERLLAVAAYACASQLVSSSAAPAQPERKYADGSAGPVTSTERNVRSLVGPPIVFVGSVLAELLFP